MRTKTKIQLFTQLDVPKNRQNKPKHLPVRCDQCSARQDNKSHGPIIQAVELEQEQHHRDKTFRKI
jgi:hypothetical protein